VGRPFQAADPLSSGSSRLKAGCRPEGLPHILLLLLTGCGRYADFKLPEPAEPASKVKLALSTRPAPVLSRGAAGAFDSHDALNPSVVRRDGSLYNFYSGWDGAIWRTGLATSRDGIDWQKQGVVLEPDASTWEGKYIAGNGSALLVDGQFWYWFVGGPKDVPKLGLARSPDGRRFTKERNPVLEPGPRGSWDERGVADPYVIRKGAYFYLFYLGQDRARRQRLGVARSTDGIRFEKLRTNPILEIGEDGNFDEQGLGEPAVWQSMGWYWMLYTGRDRDERRRMGLAQSRDGVQWRKLPNVFAGNDAWNNEVVCDPEVDLGASAVNFWFGGGNVRRPDENLNGQIGAGALMPVSDAAK
jgi:predicted GH43/DUF377 family glycosyl hydrolase